MPKTVHGRVHRSDCEKPFLPMTQLLICSDHFSPKCYTRDLCLLADTGFPTKYAKLKPDDVPSIFTGRAPSETKDGSRVKLRQTRVHTFVGYLVRCPRKHQEVASFQQSASEATKTDHFAQSERHSMHCAHCRQVWKRSSLFIFCFARTSAETAPSSLRFYLFYKNRAC